MIAGQMLVEDLDGLRHRAVEGERVKEANVNDPAVIGFADDLAQAVLNLRGSKAGIVDAAEDENGPRERLGIVGHRAPGDLGVVAGQREGGIHLL